MAEGKRGRKFGRQSRNESGKGQELRTKMNKQRRIKRNAEIKATADRNKKLG